MKNENAIVITTINMPTILESLGENITKYHHENDTSIIIIGDKKTPKGIENYCEKIKTKYKIDIEYLGINDQKKAFKNHKDLLNLFPYNHPDRTMLGHCLAYIRGFERSIALDDDNFPTNCDFIGFHSITGKVKNVQLLKSNTGWFNVHSLLNEQSKIPFYPRGYPWTKRHVKEGKIETVVESKMIVANQGLVLEDPDIDAISRLFHPIRATSMSNKYGKQFGLYPGVWSPLNYQNTCFLQICITLFQQVS